MDNVLKDTADLLTYTIKSIEDFQNTLEEREWADFYDHFCPVLRNLRSQELRIDELIRWD